MFNKNIILLISVIILFVIVGILFFNNKSNDLNKQENIENRGVINQGDYEDNLSGLNNQKLAIFSEDQRNRPSSLEIVMSLDKEKCSELEKNSKECIEIIDSIQKAIDNKDSQACFNISRIFGPQLISFCNRKVNFPDIRNSLKKTNE